jgi:hypothetical protein
MSMFRVYIRRATTKSPVWDWAQTVSAKTDGDALNRAYQSWVESKPNPAAPALSACQTQVNPIKEKAYALDDAMQPAQPAQPAQQAYMQVLQSKVAAALSSEPLDGEFELVNAPQGFNYGITYGPNAYYNPATCTTLDSLLSISSNGNLQLMNQGFSTLYGQVLQDVVFQFSKADNQTMVNQDNAASAQIASILTEFTNAGGSYSNPLPLGGKLQDVFNQLNKQYGDVSQLPTTLNALRNAIASYQEMAGASYALHNRYYLATARLTAAQANVTKPGAANGGMQVDPTNYVAGYTPAHLPSANQLIGGLATTTNAVNVTVSLSNFTSNSTQMSVSGNSGLTISIGELLDWSINGSATYNMSRYISSGSSVNMSFNYPGITPVPATPSALSLDNSTGWFDTEILSEVVANSGRDATGYALQGSEFSVDELFGVGKALSRLKTFVICQAPTITMVFTQANNSLLTSDLTVNASIEMDLFGLFSVGSASSSYQVQDVQQDSQAGTVTVTLGPPEVSGTIPLQQQVAYVLGGVPSYPPSAP